MSTYGLWQTTNVLPKLLHYLSRRDLIDIDANIFYMYNN